MNERAKFYNNNALKFVIFKDIDKHWFLYAYITRTFC
jgi:hypothetical protein